MKQISAVALVLLFACMAEQAAAATVTRSALYNWLEWFEDFFIYNIWLNMTWYGFYKYLPTFVCSMGLSDILFDQLGTSLPGINSATAKTATSASAAKKCEENFTKFYDKIWYTKGQKKLIGADIDYYNYKPA